MFVTSVNSCLWSILGNLQTEKLIHIVLSTSRKGPLGWWNVSSPYLAQADFGILGVAGDVNAVWELLLAVCIMDCAIHVINRLLKRLQALCCWVISDNALNTIGSDRANCHRIALFYLKIFQLWGRVFCLHGVYYRCTQLSSQAGTAGHYVSVGGRWLCPADSVVKARQELGAGHGLKWRTGIQGDALQDDLWQTLVPAPKAGILCPRWSSSLLEVV